MCIYCGTSQYRKIYEHHFGPIPRDELNRSYEIHHIDGNRQNNNIDNLKCVSLQEHYDIHYAQKDWAACHRIAAKLRLSFEEISELSRKCQKERVENGTHHLLKGDIQSKYQQKLVAEGIHPWQGDRNPNSRKIAAGTHPWQDKEAAKLRSQRRIEQGNHPFIGGDLQRLVTSRQMNEGKHPSQTIRTCDKCGKTGKGPVMLKYHFDKCKPKFQCDAPQPKLPPENYTCPHCGKIGHPKGTKRWHGDNCKSLQTYKEEELATCNWCGAVGQANNIQKFHQENCKCHPVRLNKRKPRTNISCDHCGMVGDPSAMKRWHGSNCKKYIAKDR